MNIIPIGTYELFPFSGLRRSFFYPGLITEKDGSCELTKLIYKSAQETPRPKDLFVFIVKEAVYIKILCWNEEKHGLITLTGRKAAQIKELPLLQQYLIKTKKK